MAILVSFTDVTALAAAGPVVPGSATAAVKPQYAAYNYVAANPTRVRTCARLDCPVNGYARPGEILLDYCYISGDPVNGNPWWDRIEDKANGVQGFVNEYYLRWQSQANHC